MHQLELRCSGWPTAARRRRGRRRVLMNGTVATAMLTAWLPVLAGSSPAAAAPPANDAFADAAPFSVALPTTGWEGATKRLSGTNEEATTQAGEPKPSCATSMAK